MFDLFKVSRKIVQTVQSSQTGKADIVQVYYAIAAATRAVALSMLFNRIALAARPKPETTKRAREVMTPKKLAAVLPPGLRKPLHSPWDAMHLVLAKLERTMKNRMRPRPAEMPHAMAAIWALSREFWFKTFQFTYLLGERWRFEDAYGCSCDAGETITTM